MNNQNNAYYMTLIETKQWFAIYKNGEPFCLVSKSNSIETLKNHFNLQKIELLNNKNI